MVDKSNSDPSTNRIKILIVDDHSVVRQGLAKLIDNESDLMVSAEAESAKQALEAIKNQEFDLAIVDISLDDINGLELTAEMKSCRPNMTILMLSMHDGLLYAQRSLQAGAAGYVAKYEAPEKIISAIHQVLSGKVYVSNSKIAKAMQGVASDFGDDLYRGGISDVQSNRTSVNTEPDNM